MLLDGDVGWIGYCGEGWPTLNKGLMVVNSVGTSYGLPGLAMTSELKTMSWSMYKALLARWMEYL